MASRLPFFLGKKVLSRAVLETSVLLGIIFGTYGTYRFYRESERGSWKIDNLGKLGVLFGSFGKVRSFG
jgi:hypothetical protein